MFLLLVSGYSTSLCFEPARLSGFQRQAERDARKAMLKEKKERSERETLLAAIKVSFWLIV